MTSFFFAIFLTIGLIFLVAILFFALIIVLNGKTGSIAPQTLTEVMPSEVSFPQKGFLFVESSIVPSDWATTSPSETDDFVTNHLQNEQEPVEKKHFLGATLQNNKATEINESSPIKSTQRNTTNEMLLNNVTTE